MTRKTKIEPRSKDTLKRVDVARSLHHDMGLSSPECAQLVGQVFELISEALGRGEDVKLAGFGTFKLRQKASRLGRNPKTGEECVISPRKVVTFKPSVVMRERVESALMAEEIKPNVGQKNTILTRDESPRIWGRKTSFGTSDVFRKIQREEWISLFELLGSFAISDSGFQRGKREVFIQSVLEIKAILDPNAPVTRKSLIFWLTLNQNKWKDWSSFEALVPKFEANLLKLHNISNKSDIIFAMVDIAIEKDNYSDPHKSLIAHAILGWNMPTNIILDIKYVCPEIIPDLEKIL